MQEEGEKTVTKHPYLAVLFRRWLIVVPVLCLVAFGTWTFFIKSEKATRKKPDPPTPMVPVAAVPASKSDIGVYLTGLGSVTPLNTVTVKSRVDGQLIEILF